MPQLPRLSNSSAEVDKVDKLKEQLEHTATEMHAAGVAMAALEAKYVL